MEKYMNKDLLEKLLKDILNEYDNFTKVETFKESKDYEYAGDTGLIIDMFDGTQFEIRFIQNK